MDSKRFTRRLVGISALMLLMTAAGAAGYRLIGGSAVSALDALYMAVITLTGVGYREVVDTSGSPLLRVFNIFVVFAGLGLRVCLFAVVSAFLVGREVAWNQPDSFRPLFRPSPESLPRRLTAGGHLRTGPGRGV